MFLEFSVIFILVFKLTQKCTSLPSCFCSSVVFYYTPLFNQLFCHQSHSYKTHTVFSPFEFHTFTICCHQGIICNLYLIICNFIHNLQPIICGIIQYLYPVICEIIQYLYPIICDIIPIPLSNHLWYHPNTYNLYPVIVISSNTKTRSISPNMYRLWKSVMR